MNYRSIISIMKYVMLLRGVNVGGQRRVEMARLKQLLASMGFSDVATYINSGNIVFASEKTPQESDIGSAIKDEFGFEVPMLILTAKDITAIAKAIPEDWTSNHTNQKSDVLYLFDKVNSPEIIDRIRPRPEFEDVRYVDHAVLSHVARNYQTKSCLLKLMGTDLYKQMTIRNVITARKLAEMVK